MEATGKWLRFFSSSSWMMEVGTGGHFHCSNSSEDAVRNWNPSRWYWHLSLWHFPVAASYYAVLCWTVEKNHSSLKTLPNHRKEGKPQALVWSLQFAEHISKHVASVTVWESDEVSNLFTGQTPLVEGEGEVVCLAIWYFSSPSLSGSLQACFYMWPCSIIIMVLGEHEHFFWLHLFFSPPTHPRWSGSWTEWEQCENECRENVWLSSSVGSCWVERQLFFSHTLASDCCSLRDENRPFMGGAVQPTSREKGLRVISSRTYF